MLPWKDYTAEEVKGKVRVTKVSTLHNFAPLRCRHGSQGYRRFSLMEASYRCLLMPKRDSW